MLLSFYFYATLEWMSTGWPTPTLWVVFGWCFQKESSIVVLWKISMRLLQTCIYNITIALKLYWENLLLGTSCDINHWKILKFGIFDKWIPFNSDICNFRKNGNYTYITVHLIHGKTFWHCGWTGGITIQR